MTSWKAACPGDRTLIGSLEDEAPLLAALS